MQTRFLCEATMAVHPPRKMHAAQMRVTVYSVLASSGYQFVQEEVLRELVSGASAFREESPVCRLRSVPFHDKLRFLATPGPELKRPYE
eukprot:gene15807-biopygen3266